MILFLHTKNKLNFILSLMLRLMILYNISLQYSAHQKSGDNLKFSYYLPLQQHIQVCCVFMYN